MTLRNYSILEIFEFEYSPVAVKFSSQQTKQNTTV